MGSRPTAVDLSNAIRHLKDVALQTSKTSTSTAEEEILKAIRYSVIKAAEKILEDDYTTNLAST